MVGSASYPDACLCLKRLLQRLKFLSSSSSTSCQSEIVEIKRRRRIVYIKFPFDLDLRYGLSIYYLVISIYLSSSICIHLYISINLDIHRSIDLSISIHPSIDQSISLLVYLSISLPPCPYPYHQPISLSPFLSMYPSIYLSKKACRCTSPESSQ